jgi:hypothetical protein
MPAECAQSQVIIDSFLPHGSGLNTMATPRFTM